MEPVRVEIRLVEHVETAVHENVLRLPGLWGHPDIELGTPWKAGPAPVRPAAAPRGGAQETIVLLTLGILASLVVLLARRHPR